MTLPEQQPWLKHERGLVGLRLLNEDPEGDIERMLGMTTGKPTKPRAKPVHRPFTRTIERDPVGPEIAA